MPEDHYVRVDPEDLRQAAADLEADPENIITWVTTTGDFINLVGKDES